MTYTQTTNGALQYETNDLFNFFTQVAAKCADKNELSQLFLKACEENLNIAVKTLLWSYDCRGGAGRRDNFLYILPELLDSGKLTDAEIDNLLKLIPELGRWDAVYKVATAVERKDVQVKCLDMICKSLLEGNNLCAKWMPRKGLITERLRGYMNKCLGRNMGRGQFRKLLVENTKVVETKMSQRKWENINYQAVPSVAGARYARAFTKHDETRYYKYLQDVEDGNAKINTAALYPHDIARMISTSATADILWDNLKSYNIPGNILCMADVSGSMCTEISGSVMARTLAVTLSIYFAERSKSNLYKNKLIAFSAKPAWIDFDGLSKFSDKLRIALHSCPNPYSTDFEAAYDLILGTAIAHNATPEDIPDVLLVFSDMQFDGCSSNTTHFSSIKHRFESAGYKMPKLVFWNLVSYCNGVPIPSPLGEDAVMLSGYSPKAVEVALGSKSAIQVLLDVVDIDRYNWR